MSSGLQTSSQAAFVVTSIDDWYDPRWGGAFNATFTYTIQPEDVVGGSVAAWDLIPTYTGPGTVTTGWLTGHQARVSVLAGGVISTADQDYKLSLQAGDQIVVSVQVKDAPFDPSHFDFTFVDRDPGDSDPDDGVPDDGVPGDTGPDTYGDANDRIHETKPVSWIDAGGGNNEIKTGDGDDTLTSGDGNDKILAGGGNNTVDAGDGRNEVHTGAGDDHVTTGAGDDKILAGGGTNWIDAGDGRNEVHTGAGDDDITTGSGDDKIFAGEGANTVAAGDGRNEVHTGNGDDAIATGSGDDKIFAREGDNTVDAGDGRNEVHAGSGDDDITTGAGDDKVFAGEGANTVAAGDGRNEVHTGNGDDAITTGSGDDKIFARDGDNTVDAGGGRNQVHTGSGDDIVTTGDGDDAVYTNGGDDVVTLGAGNNKAYLGSGDDRVNLTWAELSQGRSLIDGGAGYDTVLVTLTADEARDASIVDQLEAFRAQLGAQPWGTHRLGPGETTLRNFEALEIATPAGAADDVAATDQDTAIHIDVLANDAGPYGGTGTLRVIAVDDSGLPQGASATVGATNQDIVFDPGDAFRWLPDGATAVTTLTYTLEDSQGATDVATVTITITGTDDAAIVSAGPTDDNEVVEDVNGVAGGQLTVADPDEGDAAFVPLPRVDGTYGVFAIDAAGVWTYDLDGSLPGVQALGEGESLTDTLTVATIDGTTYDLTVTILGTDDDAVVGGQTTGAVTEGDFGDVTTATGSITVHDVDGSPSFAGATATGFYGAIEVDAAGAVWTYTLDQYSVQHLGGLHVEVDQLTLTDSEGNTQTISITINGTNDPALVSAGGNDDNEVVEDQDTTAGGKLRVIDLDVSEDMFLALHYEYGAYGLFSFDRFGNWTYALDDTGSAVQALGEGETLSDTLTVTTIDGTTYDLTVTILGIDDDAVVGGQTTGAVTEGDFGDVTTATGSITVHDVDGSPSFAGATATGLYGAIEVDAAGAVWTYTLDQYSVQHLGGLHVEVDQLTLTDSEGNTQTISITISGTNDPALVSAGGNDDNEVVEDQDTTAGGKLRVIDLDVGEDMFLALHYEYGAYGLFSFDRFGNWTYALDDTGSAVQALGEGETLSDTLTVTTIDGTTYDLTVTILGTDDDAVVGGQTTGAVTEGDPGDVATATGSITVQDIDGSPSFAGATAAGLYGQIEVDAAGAVWTYTLDQDLVQPLRDMQVEVDELTLTDSEGNTQTISITITGTNDAAIVSAGPNDDNEVVEDQDSTAGGQLTVVDPDEGDAEFVWLPRIDSTYGVFAIDATGVWTYDLDGSLPVVQALDEGESLTDTLTVATLDGTIYDLNVTILGADDAPQVSGPIDYGPTHEDAGTLELDLLTNATSASGSDLDVDIISVSTVSDPRHLQYDYDPETGSFEFDLDAFSYLARSEVELVVVTFSVVDENGLSALNNASFLVEGRNDPVVITQIDDAATIEADDTLTRDLYLEDFQDTDLSNIADTGVGRYTSSSSHQNAAMPGWQILGNGGVLEPSNAQFSVLPQLPDAGLGAKIGYLDVMASAKTKVGAFDPDSTYEVTFDVYSRVDYGYGNIPFSVTLLVDGVDVGLSRDFLTPPNGEHKTYSARFDAASVAFANALVGRDLTLVISNESGQGGPWGQLNFDNVAVSDLGADDREDPATSLTDNHDFQADFQSPPSTGWIGGSYTFGGIEGWTGSNLYLVEVSAHPQGLPQVPGAGQGAKVVEIAHYGVLAQDIGTFNSDATYTVSLDTYTLASAPGGQSFTVSLLVDGRSVGLQERFTAPATGGSDHITVAFDGADALDAAALEGKTLSIRLFNDSPDYGSAGFMFVDNVVVNEADTTPSAYVETGNLAFADGDLADTHSVDFTAVGVDYAGTFSVAMEDDGAGDGAGSASWRFEIDPADLPTYGTRTQSYDVTVYDPYDGSATERVTITLEGGAAAQDDDFSAVLDLSAYAYNSDNGHYYRHDTTLRSVNEARALAASEGGYLATITSAQEQSFFAAINPGLRYAWLGGSDSGTEGVWKWVEGPEAGTIFWQNNQPAAGSWAPWQQGQPDNHIFPSDPAGEDYLHTWYNLYWNDANAVGDNISGYPGIGLDTLIEVGGAADALVANEDHVLTFSTGRLTVNDAADLTVEAGTYTSAKGATVTITSNGLVTYDARQASALQQLDLGEATTDSFVYQLAGADGGASATVTLSVTGATDLPALELDNTQVLENLAGAAVGTLSARAGAALGDGVTYSLVPGDDADRFEIDADTLRIGDDVIAYETSPQLTVTVRATDEHGTFEDRTFVVDVLDRPDLYLTTETDRVPPDAGNLQLHGTALTLNTADELDGGEGFDTLVLSGDGDFDLSQLSAFAGFEEVRGIASTHDEVANLTTNADHERVSFEGGSNALTVTGSALIGMVDGGSGRVNLTTAGASRIDEMFLGNGYGNGQTANIGDDSSVGTMIVQGGHDDVTIDGSARVESIVLAGTDQTLNIEEFSLVGSVQGDTGSTLVWLRDTANLGRFIGGTGYDQLHVTSDNAWYGDLVFDGGAGDTDLIRFHDSGTYDLTAADISNVEIIFSNTADEIIVDAPTIADVLRLGGNSDIVTAAAALDLTGKTIDAGIELHSSNADGTTFTVDNADNATRIKGGDGVDTVEVEGVTLSQAQRDLVLSSANSVEIVIDDSGIYGNGEANTLTGDGGANAIYGGAGADRLDGAAGADRLDGGADADSLTGGADADVFVFRADGGPDTVIDFTDGVDKIELAGGIALADITFGVTPEGGTQLLLTQSGELLGTLLDVTPAEISPEDFV